MRIPVLLLALAAAALTGLGIAPAADAKRAPCVPGTKKPKCKVWDAKVRRVDDGDSLKPQIRVGKKWSDRTSVRMIGIQAPELSSYSHKFGRKGNCMGVEAADLLDRLLPRRFRLIALKGSSVAVGKRARLRRTLQYKKKGKWVDPAEELLSKGLGLWFGNGKEWPWNRRYSRLAQEAAAKGRGLWNPTACRRPGPSQDSPLSLKVKWDAEGQDQPGGEWVRIKNGDPENDVSLRGWSLRDSHLRGRKLKSGYIFPSNAVVPAGSSIKVVVGGGNNTGSTFYWGLTETIFENASDDKKQIGDGAYLFDPDLELRAHVQYPCRVSCSEPLADKVRLSARYGGSTHEWITITNTSSEPINLDEYEIENVPWFYEFDASDVILPGKSTTLWVDEPHPVPVDTPGRRLEVNPVPGLSIAGLPDFANSTQFRSWHYKKPMLSDGGDVVVLRNPLGAPVPGACHAWNGVRCPTI